LALAVDEVLKGGPASLYALVQNLHNGGGEVVDHAASNSKGTSTGPNSSQEESLVDIDVAQSRQEGLVEEHGFNGGAPILEALSEILSTEAAGQRVDAQAKVFDDGIGSLLADPVEATKLANVSVVDDGLVVEGYADMGVLVGGMLKGSLEPCLGVSDEFRVGTARESDGELPGHPEMNAEGAFSEWKEEQLAVATGVFQVLSEETLTKLCYWLSPQDIGVANGNVNDATPSNEVRDALSDCLDFW